ncbi:MAG: polyprenol monophosphomannose synthase [Candidatus Aenigmarchaeota archaeon]|nr:polyprenol monophosphomannose synthase [Candidatus Aenigmarchaeota archaeon]
MRKGVSIIIPTYNERENIGRLIPAIFSALSKASIKGEVIVVDDNSPDGTARIVSGLSKKFNVKLIVREKKAGLSSAVLEGIKNSSGEIIGVMDADFSHPPGKIPEFAKSLEHADIAIGSRFIGGGGIRGWSSLKMSRSAIASLLARGLTSVSDPMSGFFFFRREIISGASLRPKGYKIGLEIMVKGKHARVAEVPYVFHDRMRGKSKFNAKEAINYLVHITRLYVHKGKLVAWP